MAPAAANETELEMVQRHVREGVGHLAKQRALIARMRVGNLPIEQAEAILLTFEDIQRQHEAHLARIDYAGVVKPGSGRG